jgi:carbon monoxide dehydrogenase subunit G
VRSARALARIEDGFVGVPDTVTEIAANEPANIDGLHQRLRFDVPAERLWEAV